MLNERAQQIVDEFFNALALVNLETCYKLFEKFMTLPAETPDQKIWGRYLEGILANEYHRDWAEGERIFTALLAENLGDEMLGRVLIALGRTYDYQGQWRNAIEAYKQCLAIYQQPDQTIDRVKVWKNLAISYERGYAQGEFSREKLNQGIKYCHLALESLQTIEHPNETELWLEATTWNTLGVIYRSQSEWLPATRCYERFLALAHSLDDPHSIGMASNNLGEVLQQQGPEKWPEARAAYLDALKAYRQFGDQYEQVDVLSNLGSLHEAMSDLEQALAYYDNDLPEMQLHRGDLWSKIWVTFLI